MIILGLILLILGFVLNISILWTIGIIANDQERAPWPGSSRSTRTGAGSSGSG